jgi:hypothetical protein
VFKSPPNRHLFRFALTSLIVVLFFDLQCALAAKSVDWNIYCAEKGESVLLLVDVTTPYDSIDKGVLKEGFESIISGLNGGDRILVRTIGDDPTHSKKLFERCIPYCPELSTLEELFSDCTQGVVLNHKRALMSELGGALRAELDSFVELPHSAIIQTIAKSVAEDMHGASSARVIIFSDMIENSVYVPGKTFWKSKPNVLLDMLSKDGFVPDLKGVKVLTFGVGRSGGADRTPLEVKLSRILITFWTKYFEKAGVPGVKFNQNLTVQN